jgi:hypothetical protein
LWSSLDKVPVLPREGRDDDDGGDDDVAGERQPVYSTRALAKAIMPRYKGSLKRGRVGLLRQQARAAGATNGEEEVAATADDPVGALTQLIASCEQDFAQSEKFQALSKKQKRKAEGAALAAAAGHPAKRRKTAVHTGPTTMRGASPPVAATAVTPGTQSSRQHWLDAISAAPRDRPTHVLLIDLDNWPQFFRDMPWQQMPDNVFIGAWYNKRLGVAQRPLMDQLATSGQLCLQPCANTKDSADAGILVSATALAHRIPPDHQLWLTMVSKDAIFSAAQSNINALRSNAALLYTGRSYGELSRLLKVTGTIKRRSALLLLGSLPPQDGSRRDSTPKKRRRAVARTAVKNKKKQKKKQKLAEQQPSPPEPEIAEEEIRDGDWLCKKKGCGTNNFSQRKTCFTCKSRKPSDDDSDNLQPFDWMSTSHGWVDASCPAQDAPSAAVVGTAIKKKEKKKKKKTKKKNSVGSVVEKKEKKQKKKRKKKQKKKEQPQLSPKKQAKQSKVANAALRPTPTVRQEERLASGRRRREADA